MGKHKVIGGIEFTASRGLTFKKKPSPLNQCVSDLMKDKKFGSRTAVRQALVENMHTCGANLKPETMKKYNIRKTPAKK